MREIRRMKNIYGGSLGIVVHLGPHRDDADLAIDSLQSIATELREYISKGEAPPFLHRMERTDANSKMYLALSKLICQPYWCRIWILQELAMGDPSSILAYGHRQIQFSDLVLACKFNWHNSTWIAATILESLDIGEIVTINDSNWVVIFKEELRASSRRLEHSEPFTYANLQLALDLSRNGKSKLVHDRVFGLLAILPDVVGKHMEPFHDYRLAPKNAFVEFTKSIIETTGDLGVLCMRNFSQTIKPTWAVDWQLEQDRIYLHRDWRK